MNTRPRVDRPATPASRAPVVTGVKSLVRCLFQRCAGLVLLLATGAGALAQSQSAGSERPPEVLQQTADEGSGSDETSAEDILQSLLKRRPVHDVIPSSRMRSRGPTPAERPLFPEGTRVVDQVGSLSHDGQVWFFVPAEPRLESLVKLLPNAVLEAMARSAAGADGPMHFAVSGELTVFQGENYLLPRVAERANPAPPAPSVTVPSPVAVDAPAPDILDILRQQRPEMEMLPPAHAQAALPRLSAGVRPVLPDGTPLVSRPGRVTHEGSWWVFVFESDRPDAPEPPIKILPSRSLEIMTQAHARGAAGLVFIVSGEISAFDGENYLLVRSAIRRVELGNIRK